MSPEALTLQPVPIITFGYIMQVFISLLIVLAFIYLIAKYLLPKMKMASTGKFIKIIDVAYLEPQVAAYILKAGKNSWLVAVSNKNIVKIDKIEESLS